VHQEEGAQHSEWQGQRHDQDAAEVHQENDVGQRDENDLLDQRMPQRVNGGLNQFGAS